MAKSFSRTFTDEPKYLSTEEESEQEDKDVTDEVNFSDDSLPEGIYSMAIASAIRDSRRLAIAGQEEAAFPAIRCMRLAVSLLLVYILIGMQFWLTIETKRLVSPMSVHDIREIYSKYEQVMYTDAGGVEHVWYNTLGKPRGIEGYYNASNFDRFDTDEKDLICMIPLTKPAFTIVVLFIWVITCMGEIRKMASIFVLIWGLPRVSSMADSLTFDDLDVDAGEARVAGLTLPVKALVIGGFLIPRFFLTVTLMWLGGRWLLATTGFADVLLNSIALEFILLLQDMLYAVVVPAHTKKETEGTFLPASTKSAADCKSLFNTFVLAIISAIYVFSFFYGWQGVLPGYQWDVASICEDYLEERMAV